MTRPKRISRGVTEAKRFPTKLQTGPSTATDDHRSAARVAEEKSVVQGTQAIGRAFAILRSFNVGRLELSISELASACQMSPSTTHRMCRALVVEGFLQQDESSARYSLGHASVLLGQLAQRSQGLDRALSMLKYVGTATGESINLGIRVGLIPTVLLRVESTFPLRLEQPPGTQVPIHASAIGKTFLAWSPDPKALLDSLKPLPRFTENTLITTNDLVKDIVTTRNRGYSIDDEEGILGVRCVGAPILDEAGIATAAVGIQVPAARMSKARFAELGEMSMTLGRDLAKVLLQGRSPFAPTR